MDDQDFYKQNTLPHLTKEGFSFPIPKQIGPYKIEMLLYKGGMSYLYLGKHSQKGISIAVKVLSPKFMTHPEMVHHFLKEAEIIALTDHPNIIKLYGQGKWDNGLYIAMEFIQGISLKQFIIQQNLSLKSALDIILHIAYALLHLHTHGVIHRDLKPENILITENGQIKVIDFGIAQLTQETKHSPFNSEGQFLGTPSYMSPEQRKNPLNVTFATDIYALGVIAFELIVGKLSFGSIQLSLLPQKLRPIIEKALSSLVDERYQDIVDFITDISHFLKNDGEKITSLQNEDVKEIWKQLKEAHQQLIPSTLPKWDSFDIGLAQIEKDPTLGTYYDFFRFANQSFLILLAEIQEHKIHSFAQIGLLKGIILALIHEFLSSIEKPFDPISFTSLLNTLFLSLKKPFKISFHLIHLMPLENCFAFISCGFSPLVHLPTGSQTPRFLHNENTLLGEDRYTQFYETVENFNEGDLLIVHPFESNADTEKCITKILPSSTQLAAQSQAKILFEELIKITPPSLEKPLSPLVSLQRII